MAALVLTASGLALIVGAALVVALNQRSMDRRKPAAPVVVPEVDPEVASIISVIRLLDAGGRLCLCCQRAYLRAEPGNFVCMTCSAESDPEEWRDAA